MTLDTPDTTDAPPRAPASAAPGRARLGDMLRSRAGIITFAAVAVGAGLWVGWGWLVAAGVAPVLISALPCLAMCALGVCTMGRGNRSCSRQESGGSAPSAGTLTAPSGRQAGPLR